MQLENFKIVSSHFDKKTYFINKEADQLDQKGISNCS